jgi:hypothetical protein
MATREATIQPGIVSGQLVRIAIQGRERATASVTHVTDNWLTLRLVGPDAPRPRDLHGASAAAEYVADDGIHRVRGNIEEAHGPSPYAVLFVFCSGDQFLGRRQHLRTALSAPVVLTDERTGQRFCGRSLNVSEGGMLVGDLAGHLPGPGSLLRFALAPRNSRDSIFGSAIVTRANNVSGVLAFDFEQLPRAAADDIARLVFEHEQSIRSRTPVPSGRRSRGPSRLRR